MGFDAGFDMVPRLSRGTADIQLWACFITVVKEYYKDDAQVELKPNYILFKVGEHPSLPFDGAKFLRFSSKVSGGLSRHAETYIRTVTAAAKGIFGPRVQYWNEGADQVGYHSWAEVHESIRSYDEPADSEIPNPKSIVPRATGTDPKPEIETPLFEIKELPGKGRGLVARVDIPKGTRILCEKPLLTARSMPPDELELVLAIKLKAMTKTEQRQFFSLHKNFPGKHVLGAIFRTNSLPCGSGSPVGGVYPTICFINHSCLPNSHNNWNTCNQDEHETIHAIRPISAGEEITIPYNDGGLFAARQAFLKQSFGFDCQCTICVLPPAQRRDSDARRVLIQNLDAAIGDPMRMVAKPAESLRDCQTMLRTLNKEFADHPGAHGCSLYYDAFQICISHGDQARAGVFAERSYKARVCVEGEDSPETQRVKALSVRPSSHQSYGLCSMKWKRTKSMVPKGLDEAQFEAWLFRDGR
ncbi:hypothetical protein DHEL01_v202391 [Diaporthe helianthi]|uniref:SET domain-containing protein n=1 Tax=Diaporthe helianthi TaxID=158607 RepID=A0A2P5I9L5_DIAHE|nr:hypothetical protein DHEL01_v202391 [Diaporthe helianthi]